MDIQRPHGVSEEIWQLARRVLQSQQQGKPPWMNGILVENLSFITNQSRLVIHKLSRRPRGFFLVNLELYNKSNLGPTAGYSMVLVKSDANSATMVITSNLSNTLLASIWFW